MVCKEALRKPRGCGRLSPQKEAKIYYTFQKR
jgi:hypothetical protein